MFYENFTIITDTDKFYGRFEISSRSGRHLWNIQGNCRKCFVRSSFNRKDKMVKFEQEGRFDYREE